MTTRAIIIATGRPSTPGELAQHYPAPMLPLVDRPFLQHVVEKLVTRGIKHLDFVLSDLPEKIESHFGGGIRWGATLKYHLARDPRRPYDVLRAIELGDADEPILLAHGDRLPLEDAVFRRPPPGEALPLTFTCCGHEAGKPPDPPQWIGWAWLSPAFIRNLPPGLSPEAFVTYCLQNAPARRQAVQVEEPLSVESYAKLLRSQRRVLQKEVSGLLMTGREVDPGIWISRNVSLPPSVAVIRPVYVGANCRIGRGVDLGPNAVIGENCVIDNRCTVRDALVCPGSYVGEALELADAVVDRNCLVSVRWDTTCYVSDHFLVGSMRTRPVRDWIAAALSRAAALGLLALGWPILLLAAAVLKVFGKSRGGPVLQKMEFVRLPAPDDPAMWTVARRWSFLPICADTAVATKRSTVVRHLLMEFLPGLIAIARGELRFVGIRPRSRSELQELPKDWRELVLRSKAGLITEALVQFGESPSEDEIYSADAFYAVSAGIRHDLRLVLGYVRKAFERAAHPTESSRDESSRPAHLGDAATNTLAVAGSEASTKLDLEIPSDLAALGQLHAFIESVCHELACPPLDEEATYKVVLAVHEVATNVIRHAYQDSTHGWIRVEAETREDRLAIRVRHQGRGFDLRSVDEPAFDGSREGGFGLYIISQYVDKVDYFSDREGTHCVTLTVFSKTFLEDQAVEAVTVPTAGKDPVKIDNVTIVELPYERIDASCKKEFQSDVAPVLAESQAKVVFDMRRVQFVDSAGIGAIICCLRELSAGGGDLKLCHVAKPVRGLFELVRLHRLLDIFNTPEEAVRAFGASCETECIADS